MSAKDAAGLAAMITVVAEQTAQLGCGRNRNQWGKVVVMRMKQLSGQRGDPRAPRGMSIAFHFLEVGAKGNKRCLNFLVGGEQDEIRFRRRVLRPRKQ